MLAELEGILPALESAHAIAQVAKIAPTMKREQVIVVNLSGRGDKDCQEVARLIARFPVIGEQLAGGRLSIRVLVELREVLTEENHAEVLARAADKSQEEAQLLAVEYQPKPVPRDVVRALPMPLLPAALAFAVVSAETKALPSPPEVVKPLTPELRRLNVTVSADFMAELEQVRAALSHQCPNGDFESVVREAFKLVLERDRKRNESRRRDSRRDSRTKGPPADAASRHDFTRSTLDAEGSRRRAVKIIVILLFVAIVASLGSALFFLVTDGGLHHHLAASGNFGQVLRKNYPVVIGNRVKIQNKALVYDLLGLASLAGVLTSFAQARAPSSLIRSATGRRAQSSRVIRWEARKSSSKTCRNCAAKSGLSTTALSSSL